MSRLNPLAYTTWKPEDAHVADKRIPSSIIVVHGLRGGATKTWQHAQTGVVWFQDLLPGLLRSLQADKARIWTFGYDIN